MSSSCSICLENIDKPVYPKYCECFVPFHEFCLEECYKRNKKCPKNDEETDCQVGGKDVGGCCCWW